MSNNLSARLEALKDLNLQVHHLAEQAEARLATAIPLIAQLAASGLVAEQILLGQFPLLRGYSVRFPPKDSGQVIQAALAVPGGFRAVIWDSEELASLRDSPQVEFEAFWRFVPFDQCEPIVKALIASSLAPLFDQLNVVLKRAYRTEFLELTAIKQAFKYWSDPEVGLLPPEARLNLHMLKPTDTDTYCWRPVEVQAIVRQCREESGLGWLGDVLTGLATTGMRISELSSLTWGDVQGDMILLKDETRSKLAQHRSAKTTKSRRSRAFPINSEFAEVLNERRKYSDTGPIFVGPLGGVIRPDSIRIALIERILRPLAARFPTEGDVGFADGRLHSFRHYFCSECAHRRVPEQTVMHWLGHRSSLMVRHYYHLHDDEAQRQMANLKFLGGPDAT